MTKETLNTLVRLAEQVVKETEQQVAEAREELEKLKKLRDQLIDSGAVK